MRKNILIFSNFGYETGAIGGQTIKVKHIYNLFDIKKQEKSYELDYFDTDRLKSYRSFHKNILDFIKKIYKSTNIVFVGSKNNLLFFFPIIYLISKVFKKQVDYIVVGGWLAEFLIAHPSYVKPLSKINGIYPETADLCEILKKKFSLSNVYQLDNFRYITPISKEKRKHNTLKIVYMARVSKQKGVNTLFKLAQQLERQKLNAKIDIYGPLDSNYQDEFEHLLSSDLSTIHYKGPVQPDNVYSVLSNYDLMLFPTRHYTEGFPGSVLDACIAGIPVVASNWQYAAEFIQDHKTGIIAEFENDDDFIKKATMIIHDVELRNFLSKNAVKESEKYSPDAAWKILEANLFR